MMASVHFPFQLFVFHFSALISILFLKMQVIMKTLQLLMVYDSFQLKIYS